VGGRLRIDLDALAANYQGFREAAAPATCAAVVKADAYGLGVARVAPRLWREGCRQFFVATAAEGVALRAVLSRARIFVFEGATPDNHSSLVETDLIPVLNHPDQLACWRASAPGRRAAVHFDTGMHRLGFDWDASAALFDGLPMALLVTHLACADEPAHPLNRLQVDRFERVRARFPGVPVSIGNSAATLFGPGMAGDVARPGIGLFGGNPFGGIGNPMATVVTLEGQVLQVRDVARDETVGYGASFHADRDTTVAIVGVGYADGLPRLLSNRGAVLVAGERRPIVGRVSMDLTAVDVTGLPVRPGDWLEFFGDGIALDEVAGWAETIDYEVLTGLGARLERVYHGD
jgi:alanine racemase